MIIAQLEFLESYECSDCCSFSGSSRLLLDRVSNNGERAEEKLQNVWVQMGWNTEIMKCKCDCCLNYFLKVCDLFNA